MLKRILGLSLLGLVLSGPALSDNLPPPVACPQGFNCSYTYTITFTPVIPSTVTIKWYSTVNGSLDHTQVISTSTGSANFEVAGGKWDVQIIIASDASPVISTTVMYVIQYPDLVALLGQPSAPTNFSIN